jgi:PAS domain S-box-containing protein
MLRLVDRLDEGVYITDEHRMILFWSRGAERITGWSSAEVVGRRCRDQVLDHVDAKGQDMCRGACPLALCMMDGRERTERLFLRHKDDRRIYVEVRTFPLDGARDLPRGAVEIFRDLTRVNDLPVPDLP